MIVDLPNGGTPFTTTPLMKHCLRPKALVVGVARDAGYFYKGEGRADIQYCVFQYTLSGRGCFSANGKAYSLPPGTGFLCDINDPAYTYCYPKDEEEPWRFVYLQMVGGNIHDWVSDIVDQYGYIYELSITSNILCQFGNYLKGPKPINLSAADAARLVNDLLCSLMQSKDDDQSTGSTTHLLRQAMRIISARPNHILRASELAEMLQVSREHLSRVFQRQLQTTPYRFIVDQKVQQACLDLKNTTDSIKEIAADLGFRSPAHFTQVFSRSTGRSPSAYRNSLN